MPAILLRQFRLFYKGAQPVGVALWALANATVAKRIDGGDNRLTAVEWKSGSPAHRRYRCAVWRGSGNAGAGE
jgi:cytolysin-activating lysine-acyltransferase